MLAEASGVCRAAKFCQQHKHTNPCAHLGAACTDAAGCVSAAAGAGACPAAETGACARVLAGAEGALTARRRPGLKSANRPVPGQGPCVPVWLQSAICQPLKLSGLFS